MKGFKIFAALLLIICFIITASSCAFATPDPDTDIETPDEGTNTDGEGSTNNNNQGGENQPGQGENSGEGVTPGGVIDMDYETLMGLNQYEQLAFVESFENIEDFFEWYNAAKEKYKEEHPGVDLEGDLDLFG